jgi:sortase A
MWRVTSSIREKGTDTQAAQSKRRRQLTTVGVTLLVVGLCCLGWVAYQYVGTNLIAQREFRTEASRLRAQAMVRPLAC